MEKRKVNAKPKNRQAGAKILLTALSISFTLGAWQALAGKEAKTAKLEDAAGQPVQALVEAAPLPTLIAPLPGQSGAASAGLTSSQQPGRIFLGGSKPQTGRPAPVARTGSSR